MVDYEVLQGLAAVNNLFMIERKGEKEANSYRSQGHLQPLLPLIVTQSV